MPWSREGASTSKSSVCPRSRPVARIGAASINNALRVLNRLPETSRNLANPSAFLESRLPQTFEQGGGPRRVLGGLPDLDAGDRDPRNEPLELTEIVVRLLQAAEIGVRRD